MQDIEARRESDGGIAACILVPPSPVGAGRVEERGRFDGDVEPGCMCAE